MRWQVHQGDILDVRADILVCSAHVYLTMSGGVGGAFLLRYGSAMQEALQQYLAGRGVRHAERGEVVAMPRCGSPYRAELHAGAVDGFYDSSSAIVAGVLAETLRQAAALAAQSVALTVVATGFGRMSLRDFPAGLWQVMGKAYPPLERVTIGLRVVERAEELVALVAELERA
jgi:O-acetyl-ADP-ribose deacetylase (regulator of RNase III)